MPNDALTEQTMEENPNPQQIEEAAAAFADPQPEAKTERSFAAILESLRTVEDSFYFLIESGSRSGTCIPIEAAEMLLGWDESGELITFDPTQIAFPCALVRKDWTGVMIQAQGSHAVTLNGEPLKSAERLRDGDRLSFGAPSEELSVQQQQAVLVFHEPASLVVLDSLLPNKLPPPVRNRAHSAAEGVRALPAPGQLPDAILQAGAARKYFGYFTPFELSIMAVGTLLLAAIIFFILDNT